MEVYKLNKNNSRLSVRSVSDVALRRLSALKAYTRLPYGAVLEDCIDALWNEYCDEGHHLPEVDER